MKELRVSILTLALIQNNFDYKGEEVYAVEPETGSCSLSLPTAITT